MVSFQKRRDQNRRLPSQLDDCGRHVVIGDAVSNERQNNGVNDCVDG